MASGFVERLKASA